jgi:hypothetical protein
MVGVEDFIKIITADRGKTTFELERESLFKLKKVFK